MNPVVVYKARLIAVLNGHNIVNNLHPFICHKAENLNFLATLQVASSALSEFSFGRPDLRLLSIQLVFSIFV